MKESCYVPHIENHTKSGTTNNHRNGCSELYYSSKAFHSFFERNLKIFKKLSRREKSMRHFFSFSG